MQKISSSADLKKSIEELEQRSKRQEAVLKEGLKSTGQSIKQTLKPANLLKSGMETVRHTPNLKMLAINTFIGLAAGYVTRRFIVGKSKNIFKKTLGVAVQAGITKMVHNKLPEWQRKATTLIAKKNNLR
jgi:hypothetical protein